MGSIQVEQFNPSQGISFDITVYNSLVSTNPPVLKVHEDYELTVLYNCSGKRIVGNSIHNFYGEDMFLLGPNLPFDPGKIFLAVDVRFEPIGKL